jgi:NitT/TauT family transport system substrate-binding protein
VGASLRRLFFTLCCCLLITSAFAAEKTVIRVGHFPNISHAQGLIGNHFTREKKGWFEERLGPNIEVQWYVFDAGPGAMESIFANSLDLSYVGPSPTINAYVRSKGELIKVISGACSGGAALVIRSDSNITHPEDFRGKKIATPAFGNTQDIAARSWLTDQGFKVKINGGDVYVIPTAPSEQLSLFKTGDIDAAWAIEPWVSRLVSETKGKIFLNESSLWPETDGQYVTTHLVVSTEFLEKHPDIVKKWLLAHVELTDWINANSDEAKEIIAKEFKAETSVSISHEILNQALENLKFTNDPITLSLSKYAKEAYQLGFIKADINIEGIYDLKLLNEVLTEKGKSTIK